MASQDRDIAPSWGRGEGHQRLCGSLGPQPSHAVSVTITLAWAPLPT